MRPAIPKRIEKALFQEAGSRCPICGEDDISTLEIHHIIPFEESPRHDPENMIVLCRNHHAKATSGEIDRDQLYRLKRRLAKVVQLRPKFDFPTDQTVIGDRNIVAGGDIHYVEKHLHEHGSRSKKKQDFTPGIVATDPLKKGYLKYLLDRFNELKANEVGKANIRYPIIHNAYKREIKFSPYQTPLNLFEKGCGYLQKRIEKTKIGRIKTGEGRNVYLTFNEFVEKYGK